LKRKGMDWFMYLRIHLYQGWIINCKLLDPEINSVYVMSVNSVILREVPCLSMFCICYNVSLGVLNQLYWWCVCSIYLLVHSLKYIASCMEHMTSNLCQATTHISTIYEDVPKRKQRNIMIVIISKQGWYSI